MESKDSKKMGQSLLAYLPPEILLIILTLINPSDILNLRQKQTCRALYETTYERVIWLSKLQELHTYLPLPSDILRDRDEDEHLVAHTLVDIEAAVINALRTAQAWTHARVRTPKKLQKESDGSTLMGLKLLLDRWLVAVYFEGVVHIYDTQPQESFTSGPRHTNSTIRDPQDVATLRASLVLNMNSWTSYSVSIDPTRQCLILALSHSRPPYVLHIYQVQLSELSCRPFGINTVFRLIRTITLPIYQTIQAIETQDQLVILSTPGIVQILRWDRDYEDHELDLCQKSIFNMNAEDVDGLWNGVIAVKFIGSHILVHKSRSLEIRRYKDRNENEPAGYVLKHLFSLTFREVSVSECSKTFSKISEATIYEISTFAYDVIQGLFHYTVRLTIANSPTSDLLPSLDVHLAGVYPLALGVVQPIASSRSAPENQEPPSPVTYSPNFSPSPSFSHTHATRNYDATSLTSSSVISRRDHSGATDYSSRGFLSTHCIGPHGKRGIWVERKRTSTVRDLQVWCREPPPYVVASSPGCVLDGPSDIGAVTEIQRRVVYTLHSYDLRDDIIFSTLGEISGTIVLGHRSGEISIVELQD